MKICFLSIISLIIVFSASGLHALPKIDRYSITNSNGSWSEVEEIDNSNEITERYCPGLPKKEIRVYNSNGTWSKIRR